MRFTTLAAIGGICTLASACTQQTASQAPAPTPSIPSAPAAYTDNARGQTPGCPAIRYFVHKSAGNQVTGYFFYTDASGVSEADGTIDPATGQFQGTLTNLDGNGPVGTVAGRVMPDGGMSAELKGSGCANATLRTMPQPSLMGPGAG